MEDVLRIILFLTQMQVPYLKRRPVDPHLSALGLGKRAFNNDPNLRALGLGKRFQAYGCDGGVSLSSVA